MIGKVIKRLKEKFGGEYHTLTIKSIMTRVVKDTTWKYFLVSSTYEPILVFALTESESGYRRMHIQQIHTMSESTYSVFFITELSKIVDELNA